MNTIISWRRRLAGQLLRAGEALMPAKRIAWARVMRAEVENIDDDSEALTWALGGIRVCLTERWHALGLRRLLSAHSAALLWIVIFIASSAFNFALAVAARMGYERTVSALGWWLKDFRYDRYVSFAQSMPIGLIMLMGLVVILFLVALYLSVRQRGTAFTVFCGALGLSLVVWFGELSIPDYLGAISTLHRWRIGLCFVLTTAILSALRLGGGASSASARDFRGGQP